MFSKHFDWDRALIGSKRLKKRENQNRYYVDITSVFRQYLLCEATDQIAKDHAASPNASWSASEAARVWAAYSADVRNSSWRG